MSDISDSEECVSALDEYAADSKENAADSDENAADSDENAEDSDENAADSGEKETFKFEMDVGEACNTPSILRKKKADEEASTSATPKRRISWHIILPKRHDSPSDELVGQTTPRQKKAATKKDLSDEDDEEFVVKRKATKPKRKYQKKVKVEIEETPPDVSLSMDVGDEDEELVVKSKATPKRKYQKKVKVEIEETPDFSLSMDVGDEDEELVVKSKAKPKRKYQKKVKREDASLGDEDEELPVESKEAKPKRKYQRKVKVEKIEEPPLSMDDGDEEVPLRIDSDDDNLLIIDEGEEEEAVTKKEKQRLTKEETRLRKEAIRLEHAKILHRLNTEVFETDDQKFEQIELLAKLVNENPMFGKTTKKKIKRSAPLSMEKIKRELAKEFAEVYRGGDHAANYAKVLDDEAEVFDNWRRSLPGAVLTRPPLRIKKVEVDAAEEKKIKKVKTERFDLDDMPDIDNLMDDWMPLDMDGQKRRLEESDGEEKHEGAKKKKGGKGGATKKKKDEKKEDRPQTVEEVMAEIGKKKAEALEKATKMKKQKIEDKERRRQELEKKKEEEQMEREEKKRKKREERELERQRKDDARILTGRKPKSRAEAARRTKALLALRKEVNESSAEEAEEDEEEGAQRKKRTYRGRSQSIAIARRVQYETEEEDEDEDGIGCGLFVDNPRDVIMKDICTADPWGEEWEGEEEEEEECEHPSLWTSVEDQMPEDAIGPANFDADEAMKRQFNNGEKFSEGLSTEYHEMIKHLDGMQLNLFGESTVRRFDSGVIHNIPGKWTMSSWPAGLHIDPNEPFTKYHHGIWNFNSRNPFKGLVRVRPNFLENHKITSEMIDKMSGCDVVVEVTKEDLVDNLKDLVMSKLKGTAYKPLPDDRNPFDVPWHTAKNRSRDVADYRAGSYVEKVALKNLPSENTTKKRKRTRKEVLVEIAKKPRITVEEKEGIYKEAMAAEEGGDVDGYQFEWNEMGEMVANPMRDDHLGEDPFAVAAVDPYEGIEYDGVHDMDGELGEMDESHHDDETEPEQDTMIGDAYRISMDL